MAKKKTVSKKKGASSRRSVPRAHKKSASRTRPASKKKKASKKKVAARKKAASYDRRSIPSGYTITPGGMAIPSDAAEPVKPSRIRKGIEHASAEIAGMIHELDRAVAGVEIAEIELTVSFDAQGKFVGIGVGGATSIAVRFKPSG